MGTAYLDPNSNVTNGFSTGGYTAVDDGVREPTAPTSGVGEIMEDADKSGGNTEEHGLENLGAISGEDVTAVELWWYESATGTIGDDITNIEAKFDNTWLGAEDSSGQSATQAKWKYKRWAIASLDASSGITNNAYRFISPSLGMGDDTQDIAAVYLKVEHSAAGSVLNPFAGAQQIITPPWHGVR